MSEDPFRVSQAFPGFLEAEDLPDGKEVKITVESVRHSGPDDKGTDGRPIDKPILKAKGAKKEWVLNKTNAKAIRRMHGDDMNGWSGKVVTIYRTTCNAFGDPNTPCIRVKTHSLT